MMHARTSSPSSVLRRRIVAQGTGTAAVGVSASTVVTGAVVVRVVDVRLPAHGLQHPQVRLVADEMKLAARLGELLPELPQQFDQTSVEAAGLKVSTGVWQAFADPELDALIERALQANTSIAQAAARLAETRALRGLSVFSLFPTVNAATDAERSSPSGDDPFLPEGQGRTDTYRAGFDADWEIDLFGRVRHAVVFGEDLGKCLKVRFHEIGIGGLQRGRWAVDRLALAFRRGQVAGVAGVVVPGNRAGQVSASS